ncbi:MAG: helix-turn-helix domain-containing protein [Cryomorphaceae bacterium]|nr:helix-turn-helix domain-containing protein [Cryomorphaceae bacterium]
MKHVAILLPEQVNVAGFDNPRQGLVETNAFLLSQGRPPAFDINIVGIEREVVVGDGLITIRADKTLEEVDYTDIVIIPPIQGDIPIALQKNVQLYEWLCRQYQQGAQIVSLCMGAFLLAQTGLLNGKKCVTHWRASAPFRQMFPKVHLLSDKIITDEDNICTGGGAFSSANLMLYLIEKFVDRETAVYCSKIFQIDPHRNSQTPFIIFNKQKDHGDREILSVQNYIEEKFTLKLSVNHLSNLVALGRRTFERRFKQATSNTPIEYIQRIRVEAAKKQLENNLKNINQIMYEVGYNDQSAFRKIFKKMTGLSPQEYRKRFTHQTRSAI